MAELFNKESMEVLGWTALRVITTILAKKSLHISISEIKELQKFLLLAKTSKFSQSWLSKLADLLKDQSNKEHNRQSMPTKRQLLSVLQRKLQKQLNCEGAPGLFLNPDREEAEIISERVPRVDVYECSRREILQIVQDLVPVIIIPREGSAIDKKGRIVLGAERGVLTSEILDLAAECSDCIVMDLVMASQAENLAILKRKRSRFRYVILYGERDKDAATKVSHALMG